MSGVTGGLSESISIARFWQHSVGDHVSGLAWSSDCKMLAVGAIGGRVDIFDAESGLLRHSVQAHALGLSTVTWRPGTSELATAGQDGKIRLWNAEDCREIASLDGGDQWVEHAAWRGDGKELATAAGRVLRFWDKDGHLLRSCSEHPSTISDIKWVPAKAEVAAACYGGLICWASDRDQPVRNLSYKGSILATAWSHDGKFVAAGNQDSTVYIWIARTGKDLYMSGYPTKVRELSWHANSRFLATGGGPSVVVWDFSGKGPAGSKPISLERHNRFLTQLAYQNSGDILASGCEEGVLALWHPTAKKPLLTSLRLHAAIAQLAWSPDDRALAAGGADGFVSVLRLF